MFITTTDELAGHRVVRHLGVVRGITCGPATFSERSGRGCNPSSAAISPYIRAREEAYDLMVEHAQEMGANAVLARRYDANDVAAGITEVLTYGTAVVVEPAR
jgi:uncharacterized protein YbjQ (UPF0145 family)